MVSDYDEGDRMSGSKVPRCEICGVKPAEFVCRECGRLVCRDHYDAVLGVCSECAKKYYSTHEAKKTSYLLHFILVFLGMFLVIVGFLLISLSYLGYNFGGFSDVVIIIGPIPLLMTGKIGILIGLVYIVITFLFFYIIIRKFFLKD